MPHKSQFNGPIPTPEQLFQDRLRELDKSVAIERSVRRRFVKKDGIWSVLYYEQDGVEVQNVQDDPLTGLLTLAESAAKNLDVDLEGFWQMTLRDPTFTSFHAQMEDPVLQLKVKATLEEIFGVPSEERVYTSQYREIIDRFSTARHEQIPDEPYATSTDDYNRISAHRKKRVRLVGALIITSVLVPAACSFMDDASNNTLPPLTSQSITESYSATTFAQSASTSTILIEPTTTLAIETTTIAEIPTTVPAPSTAPTTLPAVPIETTLPAPIETLPPAPIETVPPTTIRISDGVLSAEECAAQSGSGVRFYSDGPRLWAYLRDRFGITDGQINYLIKNTDMLDRYDIRDIWASDRDGGPEYYECIPYKAVIDNYLLSYSGA